MALILKYTDAGRELEDSAIANGGTVPAIAAFIIDDGNSIPTSDAEIAALTAVRHEALRITAFAKEQTSTGWLFSFSTPLQGVLTIKGIGVELTDGTLWKYGVYHPTTTVPDGFGLEVHVLHTRTNSPVAEITYSPLNLNDLANQVRAKAEAALVLIFPPATIPADRQLLKNKTYQLPAGSSAFLPPTNLENGDYLEFIPIGDLVANPALLTFAQAVQTDTGSLLTAGEHEYGANQQRKYIYNQGVWL